MKKKQSIILLAIAVAVIFFIFSSELIISTSACFYWHATNNSTVHGDHYKIKLPYAWWVFSNSNDTITLNRIPPIGKDRFANVFIMNKTLTESDINSFVKEKEINGDMLRKKDSVNAVTLDNESAYNIEYEIYKSDKNKGNIFWTWTVPSKKLVVNVVNLDPKEKKYITTEIMEHIDFTEIK